MSTSTNSPLAGLDDQITASWRAQICKIARDGAATLDSEDLSTLLEAVTEAESKILNLTFDEDDGLYDFVPVYCGNDVTDETVGHAGAGKLSTIMDLMEHLLAGSMGSQAQIDAAKSSFQSEMGGAAATRYDPSTKPSAHSTPLARFNSGRPAIPSDAPSALRAFAEARCEFTYDDIPAAINIGMSGSVLAVQGAGGWKSRDPTLRLYDVSPGNNLSSLTRTSVGVTLSGVAKHLQLDGTLNLVYVADSDRIKSYRWNFEYEAYEGRSSEKFLRFGGAMTFKDNGAKLLRAGSSGIAIWDIDALPTHGEQGNNVVGGSSRTHSEHTSRDQEIGDEIIENSNGVPPTDRLASPDLSLISTWAQNPRESQQMIVAYKAGIRGLGLERYGASSVDLETQNVAMRYVGHGGHISCIRTTEADPSTFMTAAADGTVRLYDVRAPAPALAIHHAEDVIEAAVYEDIGGHPFIAIGGSQTEQVKVWDVRAKLPLYELSTGNNAVRALAWDASTQTLYAGTESMHVDRNGRRFDYRRAKVPKVKPPREEANTDDSNEEDWQDEEDSEEDDDDGTGEIWPSRAYHSEAAFGRIMDSGEHRLYGYRFKEDANVDDLPTSGNRFASMW